jgi:hypothetical protein
MENQKRNCVEVIDAILAVVPPEKTEFIQMLKLVRNDAQGKPAEDTFQWQHLMVVVGGYIAPPFTNDWQIEVLSIITTAPVAELKAGIAKEEAFIAKKKAAEEAKAAEQK